MKFTQMASSNTCLEGALTIFNNRDGKAGRTMRASPQPAGKKREVG